MDCHGEREERRKKKITPWNYTKAPITTFSIT
jgi:hypothetical protein